MTGQSSNVSFYTTLQGIMVLKPISPTVTVPLGTVPGFLITFLQARVRRNYLSLKERDGFATICNKALILYPTVILLIKRVRHKLFRGNSIKFYLSINPEQPTQKPVVKAHHPTTPPMKLHVAVVQ
jgi:hypothetical protein